MQLSHTRPVTSVRFDDPNLIAAAGLLPVMALAQSCGLIAAADQRLTLPTDRGAHAGDKLASIIAGMLTGADSISDLQILRHGALPQLFDRPYAPSTLGSFLRTFTFGHVRQLDSVAAGLLHQLGARTELFDGIDSGPVMVDIDDTVIEVSGHSKQGSGYGYSGIRGLNALIATVCTDTSAPVIVGQRLRKGSTGSPRGAKRMITDVLATVARMRTATQNRERADPIAAPTALLRADSAFYGYPTIGTALAAGADVSITARLSTDIKAAIAAIDDDAWTTIDYTDALFDEQSGTWISRAEVAEIAFTAFAYQKKSHRTPGRLIVRRIPDLRPKTDPEQHGLFDVWRFHAFFTTTDPTRYDTVAADRIHRRHAIIEQVHADLKNSALAHLPSGKFNANAAWLICAVMAFNLTRAAATLTGDPRLRKATTGTIRRTLIAVPARSAYSARTITLHLPRHWPWEKPWMTLFDKTIGSPAAHPT